MPGQEYLFASFHGEDHARGTDVVLNALYKLAETMPAHRLVVGVDADTHVVGVPRRHREEPQSQTAPPDTELETAHMVVNKKALKRWPGCAEGGSQLPRPRAAFLPLPTFWG